MGLKLIRPLEDSQQNSKPETNQQVIPYKFGKEGGYSFEVTPKSEGELKLNLTGATAELLAALKEGGREKHKVTDINCTAEGTLATVKVEKGDDVTPPPADPRSSDLGDNTFVKVLLDIGGASAVLGGLFALLNNAGLLPPQLANLIPGLKAPAPAPTPAAAPAEELGKGLPKN